MNKLLELTSVSAGYEGREVLHDISLPVYEKDFIGVIGPNGGGKTTLLKVMLRLLEPWSGSVAYYHRELQGKRKALGYLPQFKLVDKDFPITVRDTVCSGLMREKGLFSGPSKSDMERCEALMDRFGIGSLAHRSLGALSGGQMQRVFLCRALVSNPKLLILDEPDTFVDSGFAEDLHHILIELNKEMAIVIVSHGIGSLIPYLKSIACVNGDLHYHTSDEFSADLFENLGCPLHIVQHGDIPHTVLKKHEGAI